MLWVAIQVGAIEGTTPSVLQHRRRHLLSAGDLPSPVDRGGIVLGDPVQANFLADGVHAIGHQPVRSVGPL